MTCCRPTEENNELKFRPNFCFKPLTEKFYARHEYFDVGKEKPKNVLHYESEIEKRYKNDPRTLYPVPLTENQIYGWLVAKAFIYNNDIDREMQKRPKKSDEFMKVMIKISYEVNRERRFHTKK